MEEKKYAQPVEVEVEISDPTKPHRPWMHAKWAKGVSPNPGGRPSGFNEIQNSARALGPLAIQRLGEILADPKAKHVAVIRAAELILERGFGKPPAFSTSSPSAFKDALQMTDAQITERLAAIRAALLQHGIDPLALPAPGNGTEPVQSDADKADSKA